MDRKRELKRGIGKPGGSGGSGRPRGNPYIYHTGRQRDKTPKCLIEQDGIAEVIGAPAEYWELDSFVGTSPECSEILEPSNFFCNYTGSALFYNVQISCQDAGGELDAVDLSFTYPNGAAEMINLPFCQADSCDTYLHTNYINGNSTAFWGNSSIGDDYKYTLSGGTRMSAAYNAGFFTFAAFIISVLI